VQEVTKTTVISPSKPKAHAQLLEKHVSRVLVRNPEIQGSDTIATAQSEGLSGGCSTVDCDQQAGVTAAVDRYGPGGKTMSTKRGWQSLLPPEQRPWVLLGEAAVQNWMQFCHDSQTEAGEIDRVQRLPAVQVGERKWIVWKDSLERWQHENEQVSAA
jgi:hypothetical protein